MDAIVVGAGCSGACVAYYLAKAGYVVTVVEAAGIAAGASGKGAGFILDQGPRAPRAFMLHKALAEELHIDSYRPVRVGLLAAWKDATTRASHGQKKRAGTGPAPSLPLLDLLGSGVLRVVSSSPAAQVDPEEFTRKVLRASGARVVTGRVVGLVLEEARCVGVRLAGAASEAPLLAATVVLAMGPWTVAAERWVPGLHWDCSGVVSSSMVFPACLPSDLVVLPSWHRLGEDDEEDDLEVYPRANHDVYVCGADGDAAHDKDLFMPGGLLDHPERIVPDMARLQRFRQTLARWSTQLPTTRAPLKRQACARLATADGQPYIGPLAPGLFVHAGHNVWGLTCAPASAEALVAEITGQRAAARSQMWDPWRCVHPK